MHRLDALFAAGGVVCLRDVVVAGVGEEPSSFKGEAGRDLLVAVCHGSPTS